MNQKYSHSLWLENFHTAVHQSSARKERNDISLTQGMDELTNLLLKIHFNNASVWWVGNGGSSAICSHLAQDILNKLQIKSFFCSDTALLTCMANDFGYENIYQKPLSKFMEKNDLLIAISSSGNSANILNAAELAHEKQVHLVTLSGFESNNILWNMPADIAFYTPSNLYGIVELTHETLLHAVIETLYLNFFTEKNIKS